MTAILDLEVKILSDHLYTHFNGFIMQELVGNDTFFAILAQLLPEI